MMTKLLRKVTRKTTCPHCKNTINDVWICELESVIGIRYVSLCTFCEKLLGISIDKETLFPISPKDKGISNNLQNNNFS